MDDIDIFLEEDLKEEGDVTSDSLFANEIGKACIISKEDCIVAGLKEAKKVFEKTGAKIKLQVQDGDFVKKQSIVAEIKGPIRSILKGERLALNFIGRMSGIATETKKLVDKCRDINEHVTVAATRKTTPGFRKYEKRAVLIGGGEAHRYGLYDAVMIKDNHIKGVGSIEIAIKRAKQNIKNKTIEIEVENEDDAIIAAKLDIDVIMLDNFSPKNGKMIAKKIREINEDIFIEISGGVTPDNIVDYASFADRISLGYITHSIKAKDFSLEVV
jgi:nicotinate-nucleotide pyrophosphorylase (carboxylating)